MKKTTSFQSIIFSNFQKIYFTQNFDRLQSFYPVLFFQLHYFIARYTTGFVKFLLQRQNIWMKTRFVACKNKNRIVIPLGVTKSYFTIGFSLVDLVENKVWFIDFLLAWCFSRRLESKSRVSTRKLSKQLDFRIATMIVFSDRSTQNLALVNISG